MVLITLMIYLTYQLNHYSSKNMTIIPGFLKQFFEFFSEKLDNRVLKDLKLEDSIIQ